MNETELREGLRQVIESSSPPPRMDAGIALDAARCARRRRRNALWTGTSVAAGLVIISVGATAALPGPAVERPAGPAGPGGPAVTRTAAPTPSGSSAPSPGQDTQTVWPTGPDGQPQQDRTAQAGPRSDTAARLLNELVNVVPAGYTASQGPTAPLPENPGYEDMNPSTDPWVRMHQAQFVDRAGDVEVWEYLASLAVHQGEHVGRLLVLVQTPGNNYPADTCEMAGSLWGDRGTCDLVDVGGRQVGLTTAPTGQGDDFDQWAAYRHPDGTVVFVGQGRHYRGATSALPQPVFTPQQLAELATTDRFHLA